MVSSQLKELLLQSLVHERGGVLVYRIALECAIHDELREEWETYLAQTEHHVEVLTRVCGSLGLEETHHVKTALEAARAGKQAHPAA